MLIQTTTGTVVKRPRRFNLTSSGLGISIADLVGAVSGVEITLMSLVPTGTAFRPLALFSASSEILGDDTLNTGVPAGLFGSQTGLDFGGVPICTTVAGERLGVKALSGTGAINLTGTYFEGAIVPAVRMNDEVSGAEGVFRVYSFDYNSAGSGDEQEAVAAVSGSRIVLLALAGSAAGNTDLVFRSASTDIIGSTGLTFGLRVGNVQLAQVGQVRNGMAPLAVCDEGEALNFEQVSGDSNAIWLHLKYALVPPAFFAA